jgi:hypothetical protein
MATCTPVILEASPVGLSLLTVSWHACIMHILMVDELHESSDKQSSWRW